MHKHMHKHMHKLAPSLTVAVVLCAGLTGAANAQFSLDSLKSVTEVVSPSSGGTAAAQGADAMVREYIAANKDVLNANALMAQALGLKDAAATAKATADALTEGATKDSLDASDKAISASTDAVAAALAKKPVLDEKSQALYGKGLLSLATGMTRYVVVGKSVKDVGGSLQSVNPMALGKVQSALYVVSNFPQSFSTVSSALQNTVSFAQSSDIPVPANATEALAAL